MPSQVSQRNRVSWRSVWIALLPLFFLLLMIVVSCLLSFLLVSVFGVQMPLNKLISKLTQALLILGIFPWMRYLHLSAADIGLDRIGVLLGQFLSGLALGLFTLLPVMILLYLLGIKHLSSDFSFSFLSVAGAMAGTLLVGILVSLGEEPLFRGLLQSGLEKKTGAVLAVYVSALYYAGLHFLRTDVMISPDQIDFFSGFYLVGKAVENLFRTQIVSAFLALFLVGVFLSLLRMNGRKNLGLCIGCHACWVWQIKMNKKLLITDPASEFAFLVSDYDGVIGMLVSVWMGALIIGLLLYRRISPA